MILPPDFLAAALTGAEAALVTGIATLCSAIVAGTIALTVAWVTQRREETKHLRAKIEELYLNLGAIVESAGERTLFLNEIEAAGASRDLPEELQDAERAKKVLLVSLGMQIGLSVDLYFPELGGVKDSFETASHRVTLAFTAVREEGGPDRVVHAIIDQLEAADQMQDAIVKNLRTLTKARVRDFVPLGSRIAARMWT